MTRREREVIGLIGEGLSNKEVPAAQHRVHTVESHVRDVMARIAKTACNCSAGISVPSSAT
jgi:DNA-binding CsgD family transcriptional regulator